MDLLVLVLAVVVEPATPALLQAGLGLGLTTGAKIPSLGGGHSSEEEVSTYHPPHHLPLPHYQVTTISPLYYGDTFSPLAEQVVHQQLRDGTATLPKFLRPSPHQHHQGSSLPLGHQEGGGATTPHHPVIGPLPRPLPATSLHTIDSDDPFEPEAEVDFLPSWDPLLLQHLSSPPASHLAVSQPASHPASHTTFFPTSRPPTKPASHHPAEGAASSPSLEQVDGGGPLGIVPGHQHLAPGPSPPHTFADPPEDPPHFVAASVREQMGREEEELSAFLAAPIRDEHGTVYRPVPPTRGIHQTITLVPIHEVRAAGRGFAARDNNLQPMVDEVADQREDFTLGGLGSLVEREAALQAIQGERVREAQLRRDKMLAYSTYKNMWTSSGKKKLVVDASKALQEYREWGGSQDHQGVEEVRRPERNTGGHSPPPPAHTALLTLGPSGPAMPVLASLMADMRRLLATPLIPRAGGQAMTSLMEMYNRVRTAQGDSRFDIYDWLPLFGVLFVTAILLNTIFPNSLFLAGQQLSLGRKEGRADTDPLDMAINQLENGVLMLSAIRDGGSCSERLACKLGEVGREVQDRDTILEAVNLLVPDKYSNFTASFEKVMRTGELDSCSAQCHRCLVI